jgi:hypothetical protein
MAYISCVARYLSLTAISYFLKCTTISFSARWRLMYQGMRTVGVSFEYVFLKQRHALYEK